jgi:nucleoside-diphosphate-sugar epimerase
MRVLLTGATGFVGSHVARLLVRDGCDVCALVREGSDAWRIDDIASKLTIVRGDICDVDVRRLATDVRPDTCIHCAWFVKAGEYLHSTENIALMNASLRLALGLADSGCRRFVGVGTCWEYETAVDYLTESSRIAPCNLYSACKVGTGLALEQLARLRTMSAAWARVFYLYGPQEGPQRLFPSVILSLLKGEPKKVTAGAQVRDFLHVEDVAAALWAVAKSSVQGAINVGSGVPITVKEVVTRIGAIVGRPDLIELGALPYSPGDPMFVCGKTDRLARECGWSPRFRLDEGLQNTIAWWREELRKRGTALAT